MFRYLCKYGDFAAEIVFNSNRDGVARLKPLDVYNFVRIENKNHELIGYYHQPDGETEPRFLHPYQVMHIRLSSYDNAYTPLGKSILEGSRKAFKQLRLMEDGALIYRLTRASEKRVFTIPIGQNVPTGEIPGYLTKIAQTMKKRKLYNPSTGEIDERMSPLIQEDDFFIPKRIGGEGPTIDMLRGATNLNQIEDIDYFKKKLLMGLKIPYDILNGSQKLEKPLYQTNPEFAKAVRWIQDAITLGLKKVITIHMMLNGTGLNDIKTFDIEFPYNSLIDELYRMEGWATRLKVMNDAKALGWLPKQWIMKTFTSLNDDEVNEIVRWKNHEDKKDQEIESEGLEFMGGSTGGFGGFGGVDTDANMDQGQATDAESTDIEIANTAGVGESSIGEIGAEESLLYTEDNALIESTNNSDDAILEEISTIVKDSKINTTYVDNISLFKSSGDLKGIRSSLIGITESNDDYMKSISVDTKLYLHKHNLKKLVYGKEKHMKFMMDGATKDGDKE